MQPTAPQGRPQNTGADWQPAEWCAGGTASEVRALSYSAAYSFFHVEGRLPSASCSLAGCTGNCGICPTAPPETGA